MNSATLKTEALCWMRFTRRLDLVCTEGGYWNADVIGLDDNIAVEMEVKVSRADMLAEFRNKLAKHACYNNETLTNHSPNYFYLLVPAELAAEAVEIVKDKFPKAGVMSYAYPGAIHGQRLKCVRRGTKLHTKKPSTRLIKSIAMRASSEICGLRMALNMLKNTEIDKLEKVIVETKTATDWEVNERQSLQESGK